MFTKIDKALAVPLVGCAAQFVTYFTGGEVSPELQANLVMFLTMFLVWLSPNKS